MNVTFYKEDVKRIFKENNLTYEWWVEDDGNIVVIVEWGDWKHDHRFLKYIMRKNHYRVVLRIITEDDESDVFSAKYVFEYGC